MKSLSGQTEREPSPSVETYWVVDVFGQNDKVKRKSRRPPTFNPEDYVVFLRKVLTSTNAAGGMCTAVEKLYGKDSHMSAEMRSKLSHSVSASSGAGVNNNDNNRTNNKQSSSSDVSDVLKKLRLDLFFSFASFCKEFVGETCDGIALLMDMLRAIQMAQVELNGSNKELSNVRANRRSLIRNAATDELEVLLSLYQLCLANGHVPGKDHGLSRLLAHNAGFYGLALALVSNLTRTRSLALQLMTALCKMPGGHSRVSEALTTLRLNMGESVRLKLLSGIVNSTASRVESLTGSNNKDGNITNGEIVNNTDSSLRFLVEAMAFLNSFVQSASDLRNQVVIQWEVEEAALNMHALSQVADTVRSPLAAQLRQELSAWNENQINISLLLDRLTNVTSTNEALRKDLLSLRSRLLALESEKKRFSEFEIDMKKRCADLETELTSLRTTNSHPTTSSSSVGIQTTDFRMDEKVGDERSNRDWYQSAGSHMSCDDEDYDIDDVIEELNNIVNSAESDMNTEKNSSKSGDSPKDSGSFTEEHLVPKYLPRPPPRPESKRSVIAPSPTAVHLDADLTGETSDFPMAGICTTPESNQSSTDSDMERGPTEISRKKITQNFYRQRDLEEDDDDGDKAFDSSICESDWGKTQILRRNMRKSFGSVEDPGSRGMSAEDMSEDKIQPDILRAIPTRLFHKSWDVLEARSPMYSDDMVISSSAHLQEEHVLLNSRRRHASVDNLSSIQRESPIFIHPMVHHPNLRNREEMLMFEQHQQHQRFLMGHHSPLNHVYRHPEHFHDPTVSPVDPAAHLGDLQVGDVFSFPGQYSGHSGRASRTEHGSKKSKRQDIDSSGGSKPGSRNSFAFANLIPGFIKSSFGSSRDSSSKSSREEWETFHTDKALMKDYRQHFHPHQPIPPVVLRHSNEQHFEMNPAEYWPPSFQAMPFRNIPQPFGNIDPSLSQRNRSARSSTPPTQTNRGIHSNNINRIAKLMDHPSGMY